MNGWLPEKQVGNLKTNQGIRGSCKNFLATVILVSLPLTLNKMVEAEVDDEEIFVSLGILGFSTFFGLMNGGMACMKHFSMRIVLFTVAQVIPWAYRCFLDSCVERRFLQRIGGRYRFLHRELLEHFADKVGGLS